MQQTVAVRMLTLILLVTATGLAAVAALGNRDAAADRAAVANVRAAASAAEAWFQDPYGGRGTYRGLTAAALVRQAPAVSSHVHTTVLAGGRAFCLDDEEGTGHSAYYVGGDVGRLANLGKAVTPLRPVLVDSKVTDAAALCADAA